jgi:cytochrome c oxidase subunit 2
MITTVEAIPSAEFAAWLKEEPAEADAGVALLQKHGCLGCHSLDGASMVGPTFQGIGGREVKVSRDGETLTITSDRAYLEKAILEPGAEIVEGYPPAMPPYAGRIPEEELTGMLDYLESLTADGSADQAEDSAEQPVETESATPKEQQPEEPEPIKETAQPVTAAQPESLAATGEALAGQNACLGCHSVDGTRRVGPSFKGLMGSERNVTRDGQTVKVTADSAYLVRAIREPGAEVTEGYPAAMPPYPGLSDDDIKAIVAWLETLK